MNGSNEVPTPISNICAHLNGLHNYATDLSRCVSTSHFCAHPQKDLRQCLLYDSSDKDVRLIGIEYMIPISKFNTLPQEEKKYWHSHFYEIKSGILFLPNQTNTSKEEWDSTELEELKELANWVGKTYHLWQVDRGDELPFGEPNLMMSLTSDEQVNTTMLHKRDERFQISTEEKKDLRKNMTLPSPPLGCDVFSSSNNKTK